MKFLLVIIIFLLSAQTANAVQIQGKASYYSRSGCLGCSKSLRMANGEVLDDTKLTLALTPQTVRRYSLMNKQVTVVNLANNRSVVAKVADTGGFARYNRVADLGLAVKQALGCKSICSVVISF